MIDMMGTSFEPDEFGSWSCVFKLDEYCLVLNLVKNQYLHKFEPLASYERVLCDAKCNQMTTVSRCCIKDKPLVIYVISSLSSLSHHPLAFTSVDSGAGPMARTLATGVRFHSTTFIVGTRGHLKFGSSRLNLPCFAMAFTSGPPLSWGSDFRALRDQVNRGTDMSRLIHTWPCAVR